MFNYNYPLSSSIYNLLQFGSAEFTAFLHDIGYKFDGKTYKLFTFALQFEKYKIEREGIRLLSPNVYLYVSSPLIDEFIKYFMIGTFENQYITIKNSDTSIKMRIKKADTLPNPIFDDKMKFKLMSPFVLSTKKAYQGSLRQYYLRPGDKDDINRIITSNSHNKFKLLYDKNKYSELRLSWDENYLRKHKRVTKKITIDGEGKYPINVIGMQAPFVLEGDPELIKVGYECGFGEKNSMGFGMASIIT